MPAEHSLTSNEYIGHHLQHLTVQIGNSPFWTLNVDTLIVSGLIGIMVFGLMRYVAKRATAKSTSKLQTFVEIVVDMVDQQVRDTFHAKSALVTPLALTVFIWV